MTSSTGGAGGGQNPYYNNTGAPKTLYDNNWDNYPAV
jgi:hypothetical protein